MQCTMWELIAGVSCVVAKSVGRKWATVTPPSPPPPWHGRKTAVSRSSTMPRTKDAAVQRHIIWGETRGRGGGRYTHLCGTSLPTMVHSSSQASPSTPTTRSREPEPNSLARVGRNSMAAAEPRYIPEVVRDTARALSCGGIHCT